MARSKTVVSTKDTVPTMPGRNGGTLQVGNPGNKGGGRVKKYVEDRASEIVTDKTVWDMQLARAKAGDGKAVDRALDRVLGKPSETIGGEIRVILRAVRE